MVADRTPVDLPEGADLYLANDDDLTFVRTAVPTPARAAALFELAPQLPTRHLARRGGLHRARHAGLGRGAGRSRSSTAWCACSATETSPTCVEPYLGLVTRVAELWSPEADREAVGRLVARTCAPSSSSRGATSRWRSASWARTAVARRPRPARGRGGSGHRPAVAGAGTARRAGRRARRRRCSSGSSRRTPIPTPGSARSPCAPPPPDAEAKAAAWTTLVEPTARCRSRPSARSRPPSGDPGSRSCWRRTPSATSRPCRRCTTAG